MSDITEAIEAVFRATGKPRDEIQVSEPVEPTPPFKDASDDERGAYEQMKKDGTMIIWVSVHRFIATQIHITPRTTVQELGCKATNAAYDVKQLWGSDEH